MKLSKRSLTSIAILGSLTVGTATSLAAPTTATPKGKVQFTERTGGGDGTVTLPETEPPVVVVPEDPNPSPAGPLMIKDAPTFDFGTVEISSKNESYSVKTSSYFKTDADGKATTEKAYNAPILQIEDVRSETETQTWSLAVSATPFKTASGEELAGAEIRVQQPSLVFNNTYTDQRNPAGISTTTAGYTIGSASKVVLTSSAGKGNGLTSLVLDKNYKDGKKVDGTDYAATDKIEDVQLFVPVTANKIKDAQYTSTVTWSLYDTPEAIGTTPAG